MYMPNMSSFTKVCHGSSFHGLAGVNLGGVLCVIIVRLSADWINSFTQRTCLWNTVLQIITNRIIFITIYLTGFNWSCFDIIHAYQRKNILQLWINWKCLCPESLDLFIATLYVGVLGPNGWNHAILIRATSLIHDLHRAGTWKNKWKK